MTLYKYINPEKAISEFDELLYKEGVNSIDIGKFLEDCAPEIRDEVNPILELAILLKDCSQKIPKSEFAELLSSGTTKRKTQKRYFLLPRTTTLVTSHKDHSMFGKKNIPDVGSSKKTGKKRRKLHRKVTKRRAKSALLKKRKRTTK